MALLGLLANLLPAKAKQTVRTLHVHARTQECILINVTVILLYLPTHVLQPLGTLSHLLVVSKYPMNPDATMKRIMKNTVANRVATMTALLSGVVDAAVAAVAAVGLVVGPVLHSAAKQHRIIIID